MNEELNKKNQELNQKRRLRLMEYDTKTHLEILKDSEDLKHQGKLLSNELLSKLSEYSIILVDHLNWETRYQYLELLNKFMQKKIDILEFRIAFCDRYESIEKVADFLKSNRVLLAPHQNSLDFADLLEKIYYCCEAYSNDPEPYRNTFEIGDVEFSTLIEKSYFKMKNFLQE